MYLVIVFPKAQPPYFHPPVEPVKAYLLNDTLDKVVDKAQGPWMPDGVFEAIIDPLCAQHGFVRTWQNTTQAGSLALGAQYFERGLAVANFLTPERQATLLALLDVVRKPPTDEEKAQDAETFRQAIATGDALDAARVAELTVRFAGQA